MWQHIIDHWVDYLVVGGVVIGSIIVGLFVQFLLLKLIRVITKKTASILDDLVLKHLRRPFRLLGPLFFLNAALPFLTIPPEVAEPLHQILGTLFIIVFTWIIIKTISLIVEYTESRFDKNGQNNLRARKIHTQIQIIKRIASVIIVLIAAAVILLQFKEISHLGTTILASAGVIGVVLGFAAQRSIATIFAGFQIAFSQPIRLDDVVIVENEWGWIEEITLTYVVIRVWDLRRLVVPITYFMDKPFQNWTRNTSDLLGTVFLYTDYTVPVGKIRTKLKEFVSANPLWDKKVCNLQVTDANEKTVELRALMSAADSPTLWTLRCEIREQLLDFLQRELPDSLPKVRASLQKETT